jgi:hypothetical protein
MRKRIGILGGMGPLASAEFLGTLYRSSITDREQDAPVCVMLSDPTFPDRTEQILRGDTGELAERLAAALAELTMMGADAIVITCVTVHHVLDQIPPDLRSRVVSLIDLLADEMVAVPCRRLLLTTTGTRVARVFERHRNWQKIALSIELPSDEDQETLPWPDLPPEAGRAGRGRPGLARRIAVALRHGGLHLRLHRVPLGPPGGGGPAGQGEDPRSSPARCSQDPLADRHA